MAKRVPLPPGTYAVGAGMAVIALTSYAFQIVAYRQLTSHGSTVQYSALFGLWVIVFVLSPGFFQPLEQEVGRAVAHRRAQGLGAAPVVRRAAVMGGALALATIAACSAAFVPLTHRVFHGNGWLFVALLMGIVAYSAAYIGRGTLSGNGRFRAYGVMLGSDGIVRIAAAAVLVLLGCRSPAPYGFAVALPAAVALLISLRGQRDLLLPGPPAPYAELSTALGWLVVGSVLTQALSYAAYLSAIVLETPADADRVGKFAAGILISRIPILLFGAVQAALLPRLASLAGRGDEDEFRTGLRRLVVIVFAVGAAGVVASFTVGHIAGRVLFGSKFTLGNRDLGLLAIGSAGYIVATALAQALLALRSYAAAALSWLAGCVGCLVVVALGHDLFLRAELGFGAGPLVSAVVMLVCLVVRLRSGIRVPVPDWFGEPTLGPTQVAPEG
jgi:O-antigen/teichoic acid export membrane protein